MAKKGFFPSLLSSIIAAVLAFFIMYFFIPSVSMNFLGVSFSSRKGSRDALIAEAIQSYVQDSGLSSKELEQYQDLISSPEVLKLLRDAKKQGDEVLKATLKNLADRVK